MFNWKTVALYKPGENGSIYANYAVAQQPPGGASLELSSRENNANNPIFDPQKAKTAEIGTKWQLFGDGLLLTATLYDTRVSNEIVQDPIDQQYYQSGEKRVRGVELGAVGRITERWIVSAGFTTMDTDVIDAPPVTNDGSDRSEEHTSELQSLMRISYAVFCLKKKKEEKKKQARNNKQT